MAADLFLGADTGGTGVKYVITDLAGRVIHDGEIATDPTSGKRTMGRLAIEVAEKICPEKGSGEATFSRLAGVGLACAGIVDVQSGELSRSPNLPGWENTNLKRINRQRIPPLPGGGGQRCERRPVRRVRGRRGCGLREPGHDRPGHRRGRRRAAQRPAGWWAATAAPGRSGTWSWIRRARLASAAMWVAWKPGPAAWPSSSRPASWPGWSSRRRPWPGWWKTRATS